jgi:DNA-binding NarL/FixJ family response regulator
VASNTELALLLTTASLTEVAARVGLSRQAIYLRARKDEALMLAIKSAPKAQRGDGGKGMHAERERRIARVAELHADGLTVTNIAALMGLHPETVRRLVRTIKARELKANA